MKFKSKKSILNNNINYIGRGWDSLEPPQKQIINECINRCSNKKNCQTWTDAFFNDSGGFPSGYPGDNFLYCQADNRKIFYCNTNNYNTFISQCLNSDGIFSSGLKFITLPWIRIWIRIQSGPKFRIRIQTQCIYHNTDSYPILRRLTPPP